VSTVQNAPPAFHLLAKPTGAVCNLDCSYCFFLSKEMLYPGSRFRMADELLEAYISQLIDAHSSMPEVAIAWQGGEPTLMGVEFFRAHGAWNVTAGPASRAHHPDERHAARRDLVGLLASTASCRPVDGRDPRHHDAQRRQGGRPTFQGHGAARFLRCRRRRVQHPLHRPQRDHDAGHRFFRDEVERGSSVHPHHRRHAGAIDAEVWLGQPRRGRLLYHGQATW
jgi:hypothetical protein